MVTNAPWSPMMVMSPFLRGGKRPRPDAALCGARRVLLGLVGAGIAVGHGPALPHHPRIHIGAGERADCEHASITIVAFRRAAELAIAEIRAQLLRSPQPTGP